MRETQDYRLLSKDPDVGKSLLNLIVQTPLGLAHKVHIRKISASPTFLTTTPPMESYFIYLQLAKTGVLEIDPLTKFCYLDMTELHLDKHKALTTLMMSLSKAFLTKTHLDVAGLNAKKHLQKIQRKFVQDNIIFP
jgi:hypothetical protein